MSSDMSSLDAAPWRSRDSMTPLFWSGVVLAASTSATHLWLGVTEGKLPLAIAGIGFVFGIVCVVLDVRRQQIVRLGIPFSSGQVILYAIGHYPDEFTAIGLVDKVVQIGLIAVLIVLLRRG